MSKDPNGPQPKRTPGGGRAAGILAALVLAGAGGALVYVGSVPTPDLAGRTLKAALAAVPAGSSTGVCPGPPRLPGGAATDTDPQFSPESASARTSVDAIVLSSSAGVLPGSRLAPLTGSPLVELAKAPAAAAPAPGPPALLAGVVSRREVDAVSVLRADAQENREPTAGAALDYSATDGDLTGRAAALCQEPANDLWLAGASTALGRTAVLYLSNASGTPATASLDLFGAQGPIHAPGSRGLLVGPGSTRAVILGGLAPNQAQLSVRVRSAGGPVAAVIQQSVLRGLTPGGVDFIAPGTAPAARQVLTGISIQDPAGLAALKATPGFADAGPALQLTVPGPADAAVEIRLYGRDGQVTLPGGGTVRAKSGAVTDVPLAGLPAGTYTVAASSDVSFTAAARITRGLEAGKAVDIAFSPASARLASEQVVPVPLAGDRDLVLGAPEGPARISYAAITADGKVGARAAADVAGGSTVSIRLPGEVGGSPLVGYLVSAAGDAAYGAVLLGQDGRQDVSTIPVMPGAPGQEQVPVTLGY